MSHSKKYFGWLNYLLYTFEDEHHQEIIYNNCNSFEDYPSSSSSSSLHNYLINVRLGLREQSLKKKTITTILKAHAMHCLKRTTPYRRELTAFAPVAAYMEQTGDLVATFHLLCTIAEENDHQLIVIIRCATIFLRMFIGYLDDIIKDPSILLKMQRGLLRCRKSEIQYAVSMQKMLLNCKNNNGDDDVIRQVFLPNFIIYGKTSTMSFYMTDTSKVVGMVISGNYLNSGNKLVTCDGSVAVVVYTNKYT
ncbi:hypothetical protein [Trichoplusia ni ascovirus 2c]|uniref:hypothetical protein n=1 Tax=Trichoplusia ni ascovirus 2c TaxID=328615 RepID=UPI0000E44273|nr:hypothetical protein TNAV2c_gp159 [Trichoplusia ni ascovirus 2c]ABF70674.1 hypothetical protein [Trichoplusia ni ascovirus 2c]